MRRCTLFLLLFIACHRETIVTGTVDERPSIAVKYAGVSKLDVHAKADDAAPVVSSFLQGESVSIIAQKNGWSEVRLGGGGTGWVRDAELTNAEAAKILEDNPSAEFRVAPQTVAAPGAHGEVYLEAEVNTEGDVGKITVITNTTNDPALLARNIAALQQAKFVPIVQKGRRKQFLYYHRVTD